MILSGLRIQITTTLIVLLSTGIFLGNLVVVTFWQKAMVRTEVEHAQSVLLSAELSRLKSKDKNEAGNELKSLCGYAGRRCVGMLLYDGENYIDYNLPDVPGKFKEIVNTAFSSGLEQIQLEGNIWSIFSFGKRYLIIAQPVFSKSSEPQQSVLMILELESIYKIIKEDQKIVFVYLLVNLVFLTIVGVFRLIKITVKPVERMVKISEEYQVADGVIFASADHKHSEFGKLTMALNSMFMRIELDRKELKTTVESLEAANEELRKTQKEMIRTEKLAAVGRLSAGLAHEIGNPIGIVQGYIELLEQPDLSSGDREQFTRRAISELDRVHRLVQQLLDFARPSQHGMSTIVLKTVFEDLGQIMSMKKIGTMLHFQLDIPDNITIKGESDSIRQVFLNCLLNAADAIVPEREAEIVVTVKKHQEYKDGAVYVCIEIKDNGTGIEQDILETVFDPFVTTKDPGKGTGLGLFVSHAIVEAHGGKMWVESEVGQGTSVFILLPEYSPEINGDHNEITDH